MNLHGLISALPARKGSVITFGQGGAIQQRPYFELHEDILEAKERLARWGVEAGTRVGLYAENSYAWMVHDLALMELRAISVPFTDDFASTLNCELLAHYRVALLLISKSKARLFPDRPLHVALLDGENHDVAVKAYPPAEIADDADTLSLVFSSGSAGGIKGLIISRKGVESCLPPIMEAIEVCSRDRFLLFLPMSNFQQRLLYCAALWYDFDIVVTDHTKLFGAMRALKPTMLVAPPIFYQMIHGQYGSSPLWKKILWNMAGWTSALIPFPAARRAVARTLLPDLHSQFGGNIRVLITGMAPIKPVIGRFFARMQLPLCETYGLVEAGSLTFRHWRSRKYGSVGKPISGVNLLFGSDGEVIVHREHPLSLGYFQCAEGENERTFVSGGMVATGDIGKLGPDGYLQLLGRKKDLIVTANGYKVHPEAIEKELNSCFDVACSVFFQRKTAAHLTCVVAINEPEPQGARSRVCKFVGGMESTKKISPFVEVIFAEAPFSVENGLLRPNMKIDRKKIVAVYDR